MPPPPSPSTASQAFESHDSSVETSPGDAACTEVVVGDDVGATTEANAVVSVSVDLASGVGVTSPGPRQAHSLLICLVLRTRSELSYRYSKMCRRAFTCVVYNNRKVAM